jgi:hypothetical protein
MIPLLLTPKAKVIAAAAVVLTAFIAGWKVHSWKVDAGYKKQLQEVIRNAEKQDAQNRIIIRDLQQRKQQVVTKEVIRHAKIKDVTDDRVCFANWDAIRLWNAALAGQEPVPQDTAGAAHAPGAAFATDAEVLENLNANAARWERLREQMNAIIEWDKNTFKK